MGKLFLNETLYQGNFPDVGQKAPEFELKSTYGDEWRLSQNLGKVNVLLFYPQNETLVCTKQLCSVRDNWETYLETKANIIGISDSSIESHQKFSKKYELPFPILSDSNRSITKIFAKHWLFPINFTRGIIVVDAQGIIRARNVMLRAFRPSDKNVIAEIYKARGDALFEKYENIKQKFKVETP